MRVLRVPLGRRPDDGASAVEYGLLISGIAAVVFVAILLFGGFVKSQFINTCQTVDQQRVANGQAASTCQ